MDKKPNMDYPTPALAQGLLLLSQLRPDKEYSIDDLLEKSNMARSSLYRCLETLQLLHYLEKNLSANTWSCQVQLIPSSQSDALDHYRLKQLMQEIADLSQSTAEWYRLEKDKAVLVHQIQSTTAEIQIHAQPGFERNYKYELDIVSLLAFASGIADFNTLQKTVIWVDNQKKNISKSKAKTIIDDLKPEYIGEDLSYNDNGVMRFAILVQSTENHTLGVLALAANFRPSASNHSLQKKTLLKQARLAILEKTYHIIRKGIHND